MGHLYNFIASFLFALAIILGLIAADMLMNG